jgi:hypothetical protein
MVNNLNPDPQWPGLEYEFTDRGTWVIYRDGRELPDPTRSYVVDRKAKPPSIDLTELGRDPYPAVYEVGPGGDTLTISFPIAGGRARPAGIEPAPGTMTISFKKATKER